MNESDALALEKYEAMMEYLELVYSGDVIDVPPEKYANFLVWSLVKNDSKMLMQVLDSEDINPWDIFFVEDGLGAESPDIQNIIEFAARQKSWACVEELVHHFEDCRQVSSVKQNLARVVFEYETETDTARIEYFESYMRALNAGHAKHLVAFPGSYGFFAPHFPGACPKAARFIIKDFASFKLECKDLGLIPNKRLSLCQKALDAISDGDNGKLENVLDFLNANAKAFKAAKRKPHPALCKAEIEAFTACALACASPHCVNTILSMVVAFENEQTIALLDGKKLNVEQREKISQSGIGSLVNKVIYVAHVIDTECRKSQTIPHVLIEEGMEKMFFSIMSELCDRSMIQLAKTKCEEVLTSMQSCMTKACAHAEARLEKQEISETMSGNNKQVSMPRERVRL